MAASREEVFERVKEVLTEQLGIDESEITEQASFQEDLDADSLDLVELIMELQRLIDGLPADLRARVFTHPSQADERLQSYERLEFLGDSVLELAVTRALFERFEELSEGQLTQLRAKIVSRESCAEVAEKLGLAERLGPQAPDVAESRNVL